MHVGGQRGFAGQFCESPVAEPAQRVHLEQPILGGHVTLQEVEIVLVPGADMRDALLVAGDLRLLVQAGEL